MLPILLLSTLYFSSVHAAAVSGMVVLATDAVSQCKGQNLTLAPDTCVSAPTNQPADPNNFDPQAFHEFSVAHFATCSNGSAANFALYNDKNCKDLQRIISANDILSGGMGYEGLCLGLLEYRSAAFVCEGGDISTSQSSTILTAQTVTAATTLSFSSSNTSSASVAAPPMSLSGSAIGTPIPPAPSTPSLAPVLTSVVSQTASSPSPSVVFSTATNSSAVVSPTLSSTGATGTGAPVSTAGAMPLGGASLGIGVLAFAATFFG
ncbi:hypothetical protein MMC30_006116 [Trapelia coarctata]|nr:hypothetical protein [Trapelia coarctata]